MALNDVGERSSSDSKTTAAINLRAEAKVLRLVPHRLRFFVPVRVAPKEFESGGDQQLARDQLVREALILNLGSGENFRHLQHCSEEKYCSRVYDLLHEKSSGLPVEKFKALALPVSIFDPSKFNALLARYETKMSKEALTMMKE